MVQSTDARPDARQMSATLRRWIIEQSAESCVGHIGSALSIVDLMSVLWGQILRRPATAIADRDRFVLAKGHAALALYASMRYLGLLDRETFHTYCKDDSLLAAHPEHGLPGVEVGTGSLGQGLSVACGLAMALKRRRSPARVFVLLSDAECNEGQTWEAAMFAAHHRLDNLVATIDCNGMQAVGRTQDVLDLHPLARRWEAFGWRAVETDGHDADAICAALTDKIADRSGPAVVVAHTTLGKGVSFMEDRLEWHYRNLSADLEGEALRELERSPREAA